jgi:hypothetical protein
VIDVGRVKIHGLLDPAQPQNPGMKPVVGLRITRKGRDVVKAFDICEHGKAPF